MKLINIDNLSPSKNEAPVKGTNGLGEKRKIPLMPLPSDSSEVPYLLGEKHILYDQLVHLSTRHVDGVILHSQISHRHTLTPNYLYAQLKTLKIVS